jgi:glucosylglycerate phosphorylase
LAINTERIRQCLEGIYGAASTPAVLERVETLCRQYEGQLPRRPAVGFTERDVLLITYPDQVQSKGLAPLACLRQFVDERLGDLITAIHLLPFFPSSSDDGFAVVDYQNVDPSFGTWDDVGGFGARYRLLVDAVLNHVSAESPWFRSFLLGDPRYKDYFIRVEGSPDLSAVVRPRAQPLLTHFDAMPPDVSVWTTFGKDQIDLEYKNPDVLLEVLDVLLRYVSKGASALRLDAVAYLWKEAGTSCLHLPQTHWIVKLIRAVLDGLAHHVALLSETNVPHDENVTYFGDGSDEAHLVYNFALPVLVLHAFLTGQAATLAKWASRLTWPYSNATYLNILASHDGIGLNPVQGILADEEIARLAEAVESGGGLVSRKSNPDGTSSPYEINANYLDALDSTARQGETYQTVRRFITAHAILLAFKGMPGIYFHSMFGSRGWPEGVRQSGRNRTINRQKLERQRLEAELSDQGSLRAGIYAGMARMITARRSAPAFSPRSEQHVLEGTSAVLAFVRDDGREPVLCLHNVSQEEQSFPCDLWRSFGARGPSVQDLISQRRFDWRPGTDLILEPFESLWLASSEGEEL